uniref:Uncharacterized protein n=1 Tax=Haemonchus placei TaxID=6290 RepID=A0A0N4WRP0_HAEPC
LIIFGKCHGRTQKRTKKQRFTLISELAHHINRSSYGCMSPISTNGGEGTSMNP